MASTGKPNELARLEALPEEIIDSIARQSSTGVLAMRLSCRALQQKSFHAFLINCISTRSVWVNRESLQNLEDVANNERLGPHVRKIVIMNYEWDLTIAEAIWGDGEGLTESEAVAFDSFYTDYSDQLYMQESGFVTLSLTRSLAMLKNLESIDMFPMYLHDDIEPNGRLVWQNHAGLSTRCSDEFVVTLWFTVCQAIITSGWKPKSLEIALDQENQLRAQAITGIVKPQRGLLANAFDQLDRLSLGFEVPEEEPQHKLWLGAFVNFLEICSNITSLSLQFTDMDEVSAYYEDVQDPLLSNVDSWPAFPKLKKLQLLGFHCASGALLTFLRKQTMLEKLWMIEFTLVAQDHWRLLLESISEHFDLAELEVVMHEIRHGRIPLVDAKRPEIQQAVEDRVRDGIFCHKCSRHAGIRSRSDSSLNSDSELDEDLQSDLDFLADDNIVDDGDDEDAWEDEP